MNSQSIWHGGPAMCFTFDHLWIFSQQNLTIHSQNNSITRLISMMYFQASFPLFYAMT